MHLIDRIYTEKPFFGVPRMTDELRQFGMQINHKRVARLMRVMGLQALLPGPHTSRPHPAHTVYPYLLRGKTIEHPDQVWAADITYIPLLRSYVYLVAVMDWYSRYVLSWRLSHSLHAAFCLDALSGALAQGQPEIFNTDQGRQFTCDDFLALLLGAGIAISMNGRGRANDNVFVERLWRTVKYEHVYLYKHEDPDSLYEGLQDYFRYYNESRHHSSLAKCTPAQVYFAHDRR
jgi:putative transposase